MQQITPPLGGADLGGGLVTFPNFFALKSNQSPNALNVKFGIGGTVEKRLGSTTLNATALVSSAATGFTTDVGGTLSTNLKAFWKLDEQSGTRVDSFSTNDLSPIVNAGVLGFGSGILANAASFLAANTQYLQLSNESNLRMGDINFTLSCWVYITNTGNSNFFIAKADASSVAREYFLYHNSENSGRFQFAVFNGSSSSIGSVSSSIVSSQNTWYFVVAWHDSANDLVFIQTSTGTSLAGINSAPTTAAAATTTSQFNIGADIGNLSNLQSMDGLIDEVGVWNKLLIAQERTDLFNAGAGNTYNRGSSTSGWGMFDFGAGLASGQPLRWLTVAAGTGIYASSNRGVAFVVIATDRLADYQYFERSKSYLIATSETGNKVLYWAGSVGTFMAALAPGSAPPAKHALDFQGFLLLMNDSGGNRRISYADNTVLTTDPWTTTFELPSSYDDEITGGIILNKRAYVSTKYRLYRISHVGGNPDFAYQEVKAWGWVPGTQKKITLPDIGEVICCLGWDRKLRLFDGSEDKIISDTVELDNGISPFAFSKIDIANIKKSRSEIDTEEQVYKLFVAITPSTETTHMLAFNYRSGAFYAYDNQTFNGAVMAESSNTRILAGIKRNGFVHWIDTTNTDAGVAIDEYYDSQFLFRGTPRVASKSQKVTLYFHPTSSGTVYFRDQTDFDVAFAPRESIRLVDTSSKIQIMKTIDVPITQNVYRYRITSSANTTAPWKLNRVDYESADLGMGKA